MNSSIADNDPTPIALVPQVLSQLIAVSVEYKVLICLGNGCRHAIRLAGFLRYIYNQEHPITKEQRQ
jgi:hypothetical protein